MRAPTGGSSTESSGTSRSGARMVDVSGDVVHAFLRQANGQPFCDGCLVVELHVGRLDVQHALDVDAGSMDRGRGRCSVCGQTLIVTRAPTP